MKNLLRGDWDTLLGNGDAEFKPIRTEVHIGFSFLIAWTRSLRNTVTQKKWLQLPSLAFDSESINQLCAKLCRPNELGVV